MPPIKTHSFRGKRWRIEQKHIRGDATGLCDSPDAKGKTITIDPDQDDSDLLETIIHEGLHACLWDISEEAVAETARDVVRLAWRYGFRRE